MVLSSRNTTSPPRPPPWHVPNRLPVGHLSRAARTHSSHRTLDRLMVPLLLLPFLDDDDDDDDDEEEAEAASSSLLSMALAAVSVNWALPRRPMVVGESVRHRVLPAPPRPSQMASCAAFWSW